MAWYRTGTVTVANGSTTVTGAGTAWASPGVKVGYAFMGPDGALYEVGAINTSSEITLTTPYGGSNGAGQTYGIIPTHSLNVELHAAMLQLVQTANQKIDPLDAWLAAREAEFAQMDPESGFKVLGGSLAGSGLSQHFDAAGGHIQSYSGLPLIFNELGNPVLVGYTAPGSAGNNDLAVKGGLFLGGTSAVNRLADYEEGSWLPSLGGTAGVSGQTYQTQIGRYVKIGKLVHIQATIYLSAKGTFDGSYVCLHGLPFAPHTATYSMLNVSYMSGMAAAVAAPSIYINPGSVIPYFIGTNDASRSVSGFPQAAVGENSFIMIGGSYIANVQ